VIKYFYLAKNNNMNNFSQKNETTKTTKGFILFVFVLLFNFSGFSQAITQVSVGAAAITEMGNDVKQENVKTSSNMEFVLWFMGSKQDPNTTISTEGINTKKQIITSGIAPNRLLIKAFLKKAVNFESSVA
jgi:hypothetical protein